MKGNQIFSFHFRLRRRTLLVLAGVLGVSSPDLAAMPEADGRTPNIVFILADDLGYGEVSYLGQRFYQTPHIDRLAREGLRFTRHYAGSPVCAPSRCSLITGVHTGHAHVRDNVGLGPDGEEYRVPLRPDEVTVAKELQRAGYATSCIGKWGLGDEETGGEPWKQGFDHFFGYLHNTHGTRYFTEFIYRNEEKIALRGNYGNWRSQYGPDLCLDEAFEFVETNRGRPFFLYYSFNLVHGQYIQPPDEDLKEIEAPPGVTFTEVEETFIAMARRMDRDVGRLVAKIDELGLGRDTLIIFTSDNGSTGPKEKRDELLGSSGPFRGRKSSVHEGGIRVPMIARWSGTIRPGVSDHPSAFWDFLPTACELAGRTIPKLTDGISYVPALLGRAQRTHEYLYWELAKRDEPMVIPQQAISRWPWKLVTVHDHPPELYHLERDPAESRNLAARHPEIVSDLQNRMTSARTDHPLFPLEYGPGFE